MSDIIRSNFNNVAVKVNPQLNTTPSISLVLNQNSYYDLTINPNLNGNDYCVLNITVNDVDYATVKLTTPYMTQLPAQDIANRSVIKITGYYMQQQYRRDISEIAFTLSQQSIVSEQTICSEELYCNDIEGDSGGDNNGNEL